MGSILSAVVSGADQGLSSHLSDPKCTPQRHWIACLHRPGVNIPRLIRLKKYVFKQAFLPEEHELQRVDLGYPV